MPSKTLIKLIAGLILGLTLPSPASEKIGPSELVYSPSVIHRKTYSLSYDPRHRNPNWVYERLTSPTAGNEDRTKFTFKQDPALPEVLQANPSDFKKSGFDRGHLCPFADHKNDAEETFYLTNISPQTPEFNRGGWKKLEAHVRRLAFSYAALHVFSGPLYLPHQEPDGKWYVSYQVIGENHVAVPTHFFKVIFAEKPDGSYDEFAYILPNAKLEVDASLNQFLTTVKKVERSAGLIFQLPNAAARSTTASQAPNPHSKSPDH